MAKGIVTVIVTLLILATARAQSPNFINNQLLNQYLQQQAGRATTARPTTQDTSNGFPSGRIIGGSRVFDRCVEPYSSMVAFQLFPNDPTKMITFCSGVMISADVIATAGICVFPYINFDSSLVTVIIGDKSFDLVDKGQINFSVGKNDLRVHPNYDNLAGDNNIALIKLPQPVTLSNCVKPLPRYGSSPSQCPNSFTNCTITGWGGGDIGNSNLAVNSKWALYGHINVVSETLSSIMAGSTRYPDAKLRQNSLFGIPHQGSSIQACLLDWGGMAACQVNGQWQLRGIIAEHNCLPYGNSNPMVLTNVEKFSGWIDLCVSNWGACRGKTT